MTRSRRADLKQFECLYDKVGSLADPCVYCGAPASGFDHVPPLHYVSRNPDCDESLKKHPSCAECNSALGATILLTLKERREFIRGYLRRKYSSYLKMPRWDDDELGELSEKLADEVRRASKFAEYVKQRVGFKR